MHLGNTFTKKEINKILEEKGYREGTEAYRKELGRCFQSVEGREDCYVELAAVVDFCHTTAGDRSPAVGFRPGSDDVVAVPFTQSPQTRPGGDEHVG